MQPNVRHPIWLPVAPKPTRWVFSVLFAIESTARASVASVIPLQVYDLLRDPVGVSRFYTLVSITGLLLTLSVPLLARVMPRRFVYSLGALALVATAALGYADTLYSVAGAVLMRVFAAATLAITLSVYIMDHIGKKELAASESLRYFFATASWTLGPVFGVFLYQHFGLAAAYGFSAFWAAVLLAVFWFFRLSDNRAISAGRSRPANPLVNIRRFAAQPRLRLAWLIAFARSSFWTSFYVWVPIMMVRAGESTLSGGLVVSIGNASLVTAVIWARTGSRFGLRKAIAACFAGGAIMLVLAALTISSVWVAAASLVAGACFFAGLDALGGVPFLRAVRVYERAEMTSVYRTYLDISELLPPLIFSVVLLFFGIGAVFVTLAMIQVLVGSMAWRHLPRGM
ncbi:MAG: MFS transporter [Rhodobiaceae bacterium]|nr:MFS transporter [Rhodobiaceae bacterium]